jgi:hypothetical protein
MGLLDEAIREHLELKRRRGGDPHEVAREEQEALQPIGSGELPAWAAGPAPLEADAAHDASQPQSAEAQAPAPAGNATPADPSAQPLEQETAELDMDALLAEPRDAHAAGPFRARRITAQPRDLAEDDLEWEVPRKQQPPGASPPQPAPQESLAFE